MAQNKYLTWDGLSYYDGKSKIRIENAASGAQAAAITASAITINTKTTANANAAKTYQIKQDTAVVGEIDIPKDLVVSSGRVVTLTENEVDGVAAGTYVELTLNDANADKIYINVATLVDVYTAQQNAAQVQLAIDSATNVISGTIVDGSIDTDALADGAVTTDKIGAKVVTAAKIADNTITTDQLSSSVGATLGKADSAVQPADITAADAETGADGTFMVGNTAVAIKGYSTLAGKVSALESAEPDVISTEEIDTLFETAQG